MMCFRDMAFCSAKCLSQDCRRQFTETERAKARAWWGGDDAPVSFADFSGECDEYQPVTVPA